MKWFRDVTRELKRSGITVINIDRGRKHAKFRVTNGRAIAMISVAISPSDWRSIKNTVSDARHILKEMEEYHNAHT